MTLPEIDTIIGWLQKVFRSKEEAALLGLASAADEMLEDIKARPSVVKFWAALQAVSAIEAAKQPAKPAPELPDPPSSEAPSAPFAGEHGGSMWTGPGAIKVGE